MSKKPAERMEQILTTVSAENAALGGEVRAFYNALSGAEQTVLSNLFSLGYRGLGKKQEEKTRRRKLIRAIACLRFLTRDGNADAIINEIKNLSETNLQTILSSTCQFYANIAGAALIESDAGQNAANCYAWACRCLNPTVSGLLRQAVPGKINNTPHAELAGRPERYVQGAEDDGLTLVSRNLNPVPHHGGGNNLVALMANSVGFHWLRREDDGFWNWKDGNMDSVKHNATLKVRNEIRMAKRMYFKISDRYLSDLIGPTARRKFIFRYTDMKFMAYFYVPNAGIQVAC